MNYDKNRNNSAFTSLNDSEKTKLLYCCKVFGITKADVLRWGLADLYGKAQKVEAYFAEK